MVDSGDGGKDPSSEAELGPCPLPKAIPCLMDHASKAARPNQRRTVDNFGSMEQIELR